MSEHFHYMQEALAEARKAAEVNEVPIGAIVVKNNQIISRAHNLVEKNKDVSGHAEIIALREASRALGDWRLNNCSVYVTLEPCTMCIGAMILSRIENLFFSALDPRQGAVGSLYDLSILKQLPHQINVFSGLLKEESETLLKIFFQNIRKA